MYLHELDLFCKHTLNVKHYLRYADDIVVVSGNEQGLEIVYEKIRAFLEGTLSLLVHKKSITTIYHGVDVLGVIFFLGMVY